MNPATICWRRNFNPRIFRPRSSSQAAASAGVGCRRKDRASSSLRASMAARRVMGGGGRTSRRAWLMTLHRRESARSCVLAQEVLARTGQRVGVIGAMATPQGLLPYTIEVVDDDATLTGHAGLPLVLETMRALGVSEVLDDALGIRRRNNGVSTRRFSSGSPLSREGEGGWGVRSAGERCRLGLAVDPAAGAAERPTPAKRRSKIPAAGLGRV